MVNKILSRYGRQADLLHHPDKLDGIEKSAAADVEPANLLHHPGEPDGVGQVARRRPVASSALFSSARTIYD